MDFIVNFFIILGMIAAVIGIAVALAFSVEAIDRRLGWPWGGLIMISVFGVLVAAAMAAILTASASPFHSAEPAGTPSGPSECPDP